MLRVTSIGAFLLLAALAIARAAGAPADPRDADPRDALIRGVKEIARPGVPGGVLAAGPNAIPVVVGRIGEQTLAPVVVAGELGKGRVVAFGHDGLAGKEAIGVEQTGVLLVNAVNWARHRPPTGDRPVRVLVRGSDALAELLTARGMTVQKARGEHLAGALADVDVVCIVGIGLSDGDAGAVRAFVTAGGGLLAFQTGWGWQQLNPSLEMWQNPLNKVLAPAGIQWADAMLDGTSEHGFDAQLSPSPACNAIAAIDLLAGTEHVPEASRAQAEETLSLAIRTIAADDQFLRPRLAALRGNRPAPVPSDSKPLRGADGLARVLLTLDLDENRRAAPDQVRAHPAAKEFPGLPPADAQEITRTVELDTRIPGWHSLGLYAVPGRPIAVETPIAAEVAGLRVRIGCHSDQLWSLDQWKRAPEVTTSCPLKGIQTQAVSAFGGLIYIEVPETCRLGAVNVKLGGAIESPLFILGRTSPDEWKSSIRSRPGPWAELATDKVIVSIPSDLVRDLDDPTEVCRVWDRVLDAAADLATIPHERARPERYVADIQISAGYMHSGYPIMTHLDAARAMVSADALKSGQWGLFHELGHNHQSPLWTFGGTTEVTCNLFSLYIMETVCAKPVSAGHDALKDRAALLGRYFAQPASLERWSKDPFTALCMYQQMREAFGWEAYKRVFAEYRGLPEGEHPRTDQDKRDQWMVRMSRVTGKNLGPFFEAWGVPTTESARASVAELPKWMPEEMPAK